MKLKVSKNLLSVFLVFSVIFLTTSCSEKDDTEKDNIESTLSKSLSEENFSNFLIEVPNPPSSLSKISEGVYSKPRSNYGLSPVIDFIVNDDNTIDVLFRSEGKKFLLRISLETESIVKEFLIPAKVDNEKRFLGFESLGNEKYIIGYSADNSHGDNNAEAWYTAFDGTTGEELFSTRIWGEKSLEEVDSKGAPAQAGSAVIRYNKTDNIIALYLSHTMKWNDGVRHQAGWFGFLDGTSGELLTNSEGKVKGNEWFFSHNFDQRCILSSDNKFYALAHGDAYPRALGISKWSHENGLESKYDYYKIQNGSTGNNTTLTTTGDLAELSDGNVAVVYSTEDERSKRDLKLAIITGLSSNTIELAQESWITNLDNEHVGWGSKVLQYGDQNVIIGWNTFDDDNQGTGSHFSLVNLSGTSISDVYSLDNTVLYPAQSFKKSADGKYVIFVSSENNALSVHLISIE